MNLSPAQMQFLADRGLSLQDVIEFASMGEVRSSGAERQARYRARQKAENEDGGVTSDVTRDATQGDEAPLSRPPNDINSNPPTHTPEHKPRARKADDFPCPDWCEPDVWRDLKRNRKTKKLTNTPTAHKNFVAAVEAMADDHWPPGKVVEDIVARGWGGAHDPRENRKPGNDNRTKPSGTATAAQRALAIVEGRSH